MAVFKAPNGYLFDPSSGLYYIERQLLNEAGQPLRHITWFNADTGQYTQQAYPAAAPAKGGSAAQSAMPAAQSGAVAKPLSKAVRALSRPGIRLLIMSLVAVFGISSAAMAMVFNPIESFNPTAEEGYFPTGTFVRKDTRGELIIKFGAEPEISRDIKLTVTTPQNGNELLLEDSIFMDASFKKQSNFIAAAFWTPGCPYDFTDKDNEGLYFYVVSEKEIVVEANENWKAANPDTALPDGTYKLVEGSGSGAKPTKPTKPEKPTGKPGSTSKPESKPSTSSSSKPTPIEDKVPPNDGKGTSGSQSSKPADSKSGSSSADSGSESSSNSDNSNAGAGTDGGAVTSSSAAPPKEEQKRPCTRTNIPAIKEPKIKTLVDDPYILGPSVEIEGLELENYVVIRNNAKGYTRLKFTLSGMLMLYHGDESDPPQDGDFQATYPSFDYDGNYAVVTVPRDLYCDIFKQEEFKGPEDVQLIFTYSGDAFTFVRTSLGGDAGTLKMGTRLDKMVEPMDEKFSLW